MTEVYLHHFSSSPNPEGFGISRFGDDSNLPSSPYSPGDEDLDVDASFASSMSITSNGNQSTTYESPSVSPRSPYFETRQLASPMDMSMSPAYSLRQPVPQPDFQVPSHPPPPPPCSTSKTVASSSSSRSTLPHRPSLTRNKENSFDSRRGSQSAAALARGRRSFGQELCSNLESPPSRSAAGPSTMKSMGGLMGPPALLAKGSPGKGTGKKAEVMRRARPVLPSQWAATKLPGGGAERRGGKLLAASNPRRESEPVFAMPKVAFSSHRPTTIDFTAAEGMDVDTDTDTDEPLTAGLASIPASPARFGMDDDGDFSEFFGASPSTAPAHKTTFASPNESPSSRRTSGGFPPRSQNSDLNRFERSFTAAPNLLFGSSRAATLASRPQATQRQRPSLAAFASLPSTDSSSSQSSSLLRPESSISTTTRATFPRVQPPMRRAYSTQQPFGDGTTTPSGDEESETSFLEDSPSQGPGSNAARLILGQNGPAANGSPSMRGPMGASRLKAGASALLGRKRSVKRDGDSAPVSGMGGFGAEEMQGKVLPCYSVKADGLMRINPDTLSNLIAGQYSSQIVKYQIIDCRFGYEFVGGHIDGAVNIGTAEELETFLLTPDQGMHADGSSLPTPTTSVEPVDGKTVLVFHCEFSKKRGPEIARTWRLRDRGINQASYPRLYYPEVYVLEGGYKNFWESKPDLCNPRAYVEMDDPVHAQKRSTDLNAFRKGAMARAQSWQGEAPSKSFFGSTVAPAPRPSSANLPPLAFAAASVAQGKRGRGLTIPETDEDDLADSSFASSDGGAGEGGSPCPRIAFAKPAAGGPAKLRPRPMKLDRAQTSPFLSLGASVNTGSMARF